MPNKRLLMISAIGVLAGVTLFWGAVMPAGLAQTQDLVVKKCSICHGKQSYKRIVRRNGEIDNLFVDENVLADSVHHNKSCTDCHADITTVPHENITPQPVDCSRCHFPGNPVGAPQTGQYDILRESVHGQALAEGKENAPLCQDCHGSHDIAFLSSPQSAFAPRNVGPTCGHCHKEAYNDWLISEHGQALLEGNAIEAPTCISCHGEHDIYAQVDPRSHTFHANVPESCAKCHDEKEITAKFDVPPEQVETFERSFHGIAIRFGSTVAANCASCHGHHKILNSSDPESPVNVRNIPNTCGQEGCHPGAGVNYSIGKVHVNPEAQEAGLVYYVATFFKYFTIVVISGLVIHIVLDLGRRIMGSGEDEDESAEEPGAEEKTDGE
jgi:hypothetical protein